MFAAIEVCQQIRRVAGRWVNATFCGPAEVFLVGQHVFPLPWAPGWRHGHHRASGGISITSSTCRTPEDLGQFCLSVRDAHYADRKSTRLNSSHVSRSYAVFCL